MKITSTFFVIFFITVINLPPLAFASSNCELLAKNSPIKTTQLIIINSLGGIQATMTACQRRGQKWQQAIKPFSVVIGKKGLAVKGEKKEGDLKTPAGLYPLGAVFGSQPLAVKMDFKYITAADKYIDDIHSKNYNQWVIGKTKAKSYETMLYASYKMGIMINYNNNPIIPGAGSAIFIHLWRSSSTPTHGCIATDKKHLLAIIKWLDKSQYPYVLIR